MPGAAITLLNERTSDTRAIVSNERGDLLFASVQPGLYTVKVELTGFAPHQRTHVVLSANDQLSLGTIELRAGAVTEAVTVNATGTPVQTRSAERSALITARQLEMTPVLGRDVQTVLRLLPGVRFDTSSDDAYNFLSGINGQSGGAATFAIDRLGGNDSVEHQCRRELQSGGTADRRELRQDHRHAPAARLQMGLRVNF